MLSGAHSRFVNAQSVGQLLVREMLLTHNGRRLLTKYVEALERLRLRWLLCVRLHLRQLLRLRQKSRHTGRAIGHGLSRSRLSLTS